MPISADAWIPLGSLCRVADFENLSTSVIPTVRADPMGQHHLVTLIAFNQLRKPDRIVCATATSFAFAQFPFWQRTHLFLLMNLVYVTQQFRF
jgi:hypothetical protein